MEINLSKENLRKWAGGLFLVLVLLGAGYYLVSSGLLAALFGDQSVSKTDELSPAADAAIQGVETFYTMDAENETAEDWLERLCAVSTETGCDLAKGFLLSGVEKLYTDVLPSTTCAASSGEMVDFNAVADGYDEEVWSVIFTLSSPWEGMDGEQTVFVQVNNEEGEWKFVRILFDQEAEKYSEEAEK